MRQPDADEAVGRVLTVDRVEQPFTITGAPRVRREGKVADRKRRCRARCAWLRVRLRGRDRRARCGGPIRSRAIHRLPFENDSMKRARPRRGRGSGGSSEAAEPSGTRWPTTRELRSALRRHRQWDALGPAVPQSGGRRQPLPELDPGPRPGATARIVWHYQTTPGETWDFTATQHIILADLVIDGQPRKVLMQAPKNGFFYVLDREDGRVAYRASPM